MQSSFLRHLFRDFLIIAGSIIVAYMLAENGIIEHFLKLTHHSLIISALIAGAFFTSIFTVAPAVVGLVAIGETYSPFLVAFFGALGAMVIDIIISSFVRKDISKDFDGLVKRVTLRHHIIKAFHFGFLRWVAFGIGIIFIGSPLPDELGLFLLGISKVRGPFLPLIFFGANFLGILAVLEIALHV